VRDIINGEKVRQLNVRMPAALYRQMQRILVDRNEHMTTFIRRLVRKEVDGNKTEPRVAS
jgi:hypothetical protein